MEDDQAHQQHAAEEAELAREARLVMLVIVRAQELEGSSTGGVPGENMTLKEAICVLEKHGEDAWLEHVDPVRTVEVPKEQPFAPPGS